MRPPSLPGYEIGGLIGRGGFATVWHARDVAHRLPVALKVGHGTDPWNRQRFEREAEALRRVGAPYVPLIHDSGITADERPYIAMELLRGPPLAAALEMRAESPSLSWIFEVGDAVLAALGQMHALELAHCDLKPENIVLLEGAPLQVCIVDLGLATDVSASARRAAAPALGAGAGSIEYMAPEQIRGAGEIEATADVYAFGVLLYELITLRPPFVGDAAAIEYGHLYLRPLRPQSLANAPEPLLELVLGCLAKAPAERPASAAEARCGTGDETGTLVHPNITLPLLPDYLVNKKGWRGGVARSIKTTHLIDRIARAHDLPLIKTKVGFKYIADLFLRGRIMFGGEESASFAVRDHLPEKDGMLAGLLVAEMIAATGRSLGSLCEALFRDYGAMTSGQRTLPLTPERAKKLKALIQDPPSKLGRRKVAAEETIDGLKLDLEEDRWLVLRLSGTEPLIRCYAEAETPEEVESILKKGLAAVR